MPWQEPKIDWVTNPKNPVSDDLNRIEGNIDFLKTDIETKKGAIVDAINTMGRSVTIANTHAELATAIKDISDDADAAVSDVLPGKTFYQGGAKKTGTMTTKTAQTYTPGTTNQTIAANQYLTGIQTIAGDADLIPTNILKGKNIFNVAGGVEFKYQTLTSSGNFTVPANVTKLFVWMCGGGGSGGRNANSSNAGGGGGGSGYPVFFIKDVTPGQVLAAVVGVGGASTSSSNAGNAGGDTTFAGYTAKGGKAGGRATAYDGWYGGNGGAGGGCALNSGIPAGGSGATLANGYGANFDADVPTDCWGMGIGSPVTGLGALDALPTGGICPFNGVTYCGAGGGSGMYTNGGAGGTGGAGGAGPIASATNGGNGTLYGAGGGGSLAKSGISSGSGYQGVIFVGYFA